MNFLEKEALNKIKQIEKILQSSPETLARLFWELNGQEMGIFFNELHNISSKEGNEKIYAQMCDAFDHTTKEGRKIMRIIGSN